MSAEKAVLRSRRIPFTIDARTPQRGVPPISRYIDTHQSNISTLIDIWLSRLIHLLRHRVLLSPVFLCALCG